MMHAPLLSVRNLSITLAREGQQLQVLDDVSFDVAPGEVLGVVGESGAGKSVAGAALIDLLVPPLRRSAGEISLGGDRLDLMSPRQMRHVRGKRVGFIFQDPMTSLNPVLSIGKQLTDTMKAHLSIGRAEINRRALDWVERVGLPNPERILKAAPHELSGGQRQRIVIALALCAEPEIVIADEPTTALDVSVQAQMLDLMRTLHKETGTAMVLITHDLGVVAKMADRVAVFYAGRVVELATTSVLFTTPRHPYTAGLMGATPAPDAEGHMRVLPIPGAMPGIGALPSGCAFHPRCPRAQQDCRETVPPLTALDRGLAACLHPLPEGAY
ncbi:ABC transporter ATP-binding protein [Rhizobium sp. EC-SD404]|uniref:ABC transporter ATP-binding protein n=1 Tax=Rhizobium sp. EC-SD404 TaxID=2038389 RepID=UPI001257C56A|nr:ABC transporter ATP-binding protein [Rhizobium sp. EC-SD404]VVT14979.1 dipeptide transporter; ATP-binding component of ABC superfamily [Rhizobium sp. EC-SD404]